MDFLNKQNLTYISIFIFIILSIVLTYNTNANIKNNTKTITENFLILTEDQDLKDNKVYIDNLSQVTFSDGSVSIANQALTWPLSLQEIFDTKLDKLGVIGLDKNIKGIVLNSTDDIPTALVNIGSNIPITKPTTATTLNDNWIQFGGLNNGREINSARISVNAEGDAANSLCIVGMSTGDVMTTRKINMISEGGCKITGPLSVTSTCSFGGNLTVTNGGLIVTGTTGTGSFGGNLTVGGITQINNNLIVTGTGNITGSLTVKGTDNKIDGTLTVDGLTTIKNNLNVTGTGSFGSSLTVTPNSDKKTFISFLQRGCIIMFFGTEAPPDWAICDGTRGTPDLRGRFILGISDRHPLNETGGQERVTLSVAEMPNHRHSSDGFVKWGWEADVGYSGGGNGIGNFGATQIGYTGGNQSHDNMPPFYALLYIMKL